MVAIVPVVAALVVLPAHAAGPVASTGAPTARAPAAGVASDGIDEGASAPWQRPESGFQHSLRSGLSFPAGDVGEGRALSDDVDLRVPVWVDIGYRLSDLLYLAIYAQLGLYAENERCTGRVQAEDVNCNAEDIRLGVEGLFYAPLGPFEAFVGAGIGWERLEQTARFATVPTEEGGFGVAAELEEIQQGPVLDLQAGLDFRVEGALKAGPFAGYTIGSYIDRVADCPSDLTCPGTDIGTTVHHWFTVGVRGTYGP